MFDKLSEKNIWVSCSADDGGDGSFENPYNTIKTALANSSAGTNIVLLSGTYNEKLIVRDTCGTIEEPITIMPYPENKDEVVSNSEWYFYSATDFVITGIKFNKTENAAVSIVGESKRNSIKDCVFQECGEVSECAMFFGGSGCDSNVVENCRFSAPMFAKKHIAVMISQSIDNEDRTIINSKSASVRNCRFLQCNIGVLVGSDENVSGLFGEHEVLDNLFEKCVCAVKVKISGTQIYKNIFRDCGVAVSNVLGTENEIFANRFEKCEKAIEVLCDDLTVKENCFVDTAISLETNEEIFGEDTLPLLVCENTFINTRIAAAQKGNTISFITKNIFFNCNVAENANLVEKDNRIAEDSNIFADFANGDYSTDTNYGCVSGAEKRLEIESIPRVNISEMFEKQNISGKELSQETIEERDFYLKSLYFQDESDDEEEIEIDAMSVGQQILRPIGIDGELEDN